MVIGLSGVQFKLVCNLRPSVIMDSVPCDRILQRAY